MTSRFAPENGDGFFNPRIGLGILGCGRCGQVNLGAARDLAELITPVALIDPDASRTEHLGGLYGVQTHYEKLDQALRDDRIDAVAICTPPGLHAEHALRAAEARRHVMVEKPLALSAGECDRMIDAARSSGVTLMVAEDRRFTDSIFTAREIVRGGQIGDVHHVYAFGAAQLVERKASWWGDPELAGPHAILNLWAINAIDQILWVTDSTPQRIYAEGETRSGMVTGADDVGVLMHLANGTIVHLHYCATPSPGTPMTIRVFGSSGTLSMTNGQHLLLNGEPVNVIESGVSSWHLIYREFASAIGAHRDPLSSGSQGRLVVATIEAIATSIATHGAVEIADVAAPRT